MTAVRIVELLFPNNRYIAAHLIFVLVGGGACFVPLFNIVGYESAALFGVLGGLFALGLTASRYRLADLPRPMSDTERPSVRWARHMVTNLALIVVPFALLSLNSMRVENCDPAAGLAFWLAIPVASVAIGTER